MALPNINTNPIKAVTRVRIWYGVLLLVMAVFGVRLFYVQVIRYGHFKNAALSDQLKQYIIPASRGVIEANDDGQLVPIVLNQKLYTLFGDPTYVKDAYKTAAKITAIVGGNTDDVAKLLQTPKTRYAVLAKKLTPDQNDKILKLKLPGIGTTAQDYRTYPQGTLASQILGFVDDSGTGRYGLEEYFNKELTGTPGTLRAITDISGVPLASSASNTEIPAKKGDDVVLTLDLAMQQQLETILAKGVKNAKAPSGSAIIMDPRTGAVKAMANYPSYDPARYFDIDSKDVGIFQNHAVNDAIEVGSTMKALTTAAALDQGVIQPSTTYYDPASWTVDKFKITNIEEDGGAGTRSIADILNLSLNTGATWELMQMGGGEINTKARTAWNDYLTNHYRFGQATGIEQGSESEGYIPSPKENGAGIDLTYANTSFGQALLATPIQMAGAMSAVLNGGTYYQPRLVDQTIDSAGKVTKHNPKVLNSNVVSPEVSKEMVPLMVNVVAKHYFTPSFDLSKYNVGGKTGTAQIAKPTGGYYDDQFNGTYAGFVGGDTPQYVIVVFIDKPTNGGYAGTAAAQPVFGDIAHMLIDESLVTPKSH
ncbi:MAG: putative Peptidoglycan glycosyltransferase [Candidatus Saccharibacteria bacterium]|nr:putative Peptidoglycan glycosyltransferase [Candidatus Saccharibacteria bacterium]